MAHEFLFEPWILIHLPFKEVLLRQWMVAAFAETLRFEKDVSEFFHSFIPFSLQKSAEQLALILKRLQNKIAKAFDYIECRENVQKRPIIKIIEKILPLLEFVVGAEGKEMVKALKRKLASGITKENLVEVNKVSSYPSKIKFYSLDLWLAGDENSNLLILFDIMVHGSPESRHHDLFMHSSAGFSDKEFLDLVMELAPKTPITEQLKTNLLLQFRNNVQLRWILLKYKFYAKGD